MDIQKRTFAKLTGKDISLLDDYPVKVKKINKGISVSVICGKCQLICSHERWVETLTFYSYIEQEMEACKDPYYFYNTYIRQDDSRPMLNEHIMIQTTADFILKDRTGRQYYAIKRPENE